MAKKVEAMYCLMFTLTEQCSTADVFNPRRDTERWNYEIITDAAWQREATLFNPKYPGYGFLQSELLTDKGVRRAPKMK